MSKKVINVVDLLYNQKKKVEIDPSELPTPELSAEELVSKMEGDTDEAGVNVDLSEDGKKVKITLDQDVKDAISGTNTVELTFTEDDWNEDEGVYVKRVELNNCFLLINSIHEPEHDSSFRVYCPYFKGITAGFDEGLVLSFSGMFYLPEERFIDLNTNITLSVFNGVVSTLNTDY